MIDYEKCMAILLTHTLAQVMVEDSSSGDRQAEGRLAIAENDLRERTDDFVPPSCRWHTVPQILLTLGRSASQYFIERKHGTLAAR